MSNQNNQKLIFNYNRLDQFLNPGQNLDPMFQTILACYGIWRGTDMHIKGDIYHDKGSENTIASKEGRTSRKGVQTSCKGEGHIIRGERHHVRGD